MGLGGGGCTRTFKLFASAGARNPRRLVWTQVSSSPVSPSRQELGPRGKHPAARCWKRSAALGPPGGWCPKPPSRIATAPNLGDPYGSRALSFQGCVCPCLESPGCLLCPWAAPGRRGQCCLPRGCRECIGDGANAAWGHRSTAWDGAA